MTPLATAARSGQPAAPAPPTAADLAARIAIPRHLPPRHDGQPLRHLSHSSYTRFLLCPDDWRAGTCGASARRRRARCCSDAASTTR